MNRPLSLCAVITLLSACDSAPEAEIEELEPAPAVVGSGWSDTDIGPVGKAGKDTLSSGVHTMTASGADIYGTADQFHFAYQLVTGNTTVTARVVSLTNTNASAKAVVIIRETLDPGSMFVASELTPTATNKFRQQARTSSGGTATLVKSTTDSKLGAYLRVKRSIDATTKVSTFTTSYSLDNTTWKQISTATMKMNGAAYVGIGATSHDNTKLTTAKFDKVGFSGTVAACTPKAQRCSGTSAQSCSTDGAWVTSQQCPYQCTAASAPASARSARPSATATTSTCARATAGPPARPAPSPVWPAPAPSAAPAGPSATAATTTICAMPPGTITKPRSAAPRAPASTAGASASATTIPVLCRQSAQPGEHARHRPGLRPVRDGRVLLRVGSHFDPCDPTKDTYLWDVYTQVIGGPYALNTNTYWVCDSASNTWQPGS